MFKLFKDRQPSQERQSFDAFIAKLTIENPKASLEDALKSYITKYNLAVSHSLNEAPAVVEIRTKLQILEESSLSDPTLDHEKEVKDYISGLRLFMKMYREPKRP